LLPPNSADNPFLRWRLRPIPAFNKRTDGIVPNGLIIDGKGVLYGTTYLGGTLDSGTVFEILPPSLSTTGKWEEVVLHRFGGTGAPVDDGKNPEAGLLLNPASGKLYGTTDFGGESTNLKCIFRFGPVSHVGCGTVFELTPTSNPGVWNEAVLASLKGQPGDDSEPRGDLSFGADGNLYGTTYQGGLHRRGTVFQVTLP
jgi:uncharacterized repeat protein (TIGR03803 family)